MRETNDQPVAEASATSLQQTRELKARIDAFAAYLTRIEEEEADVFDMQIRESLERIDALAQKMPSHRDELRRYCFQQCAPALDQSQLLWHSRHKPLGYPGDHEIIDRIYTVELGPPGRGQVWDRFFHRHAATQSVRNRKDYFCSAFEALYQEGRPTCAVLDVACGPCRDVVEAINRVGAAAAGTLVHCVDLDPHAIDYAQGVVEAGAPTRQTGVSFVWEAGNAFRLQPNRPYDLVWVAGLLDYLSDNQAADLMRRMWSWTADGGRMIVGNNHPRNPDRHFMDWCMDWVLIHRTEEDLLRLCAEAGIPVDRVAFDQEPLGVNIFCVATR